MINFHSIILLGRKFFSIFKLYFFKKLQQLYLNCCFSKKHTKLCMSLLQTGKHKTKLKNKPQINKVDYEYKAICPYIHRESTYEIDNWVKILVWHREN